MRIKNINLRAVKQRFTKNKNWLGLFIGGTGSGKSWGAVKVGELLDPKFNIDNICFSPEELLQRLKGKKLKKGAILIYDEAGISFGARDFYKDVNKALSYVFQGFRAYNIGTIFTTPDISFIDVHARKLIHTVIETVPNSINYEEGYCEVKWKWTDHNPLMSKTYYKFTKTKINGKVKREARTRIYMASKELLEEYETKKMQFLDKLMKDSLEQIKADKILNQKITDDYIREQIKEQNVELNPYGLQTKFKIGKDRAYRIIHSLRQGDT